MAEQLGLNLTQVRVSGQAPAGGPLGRRLLQVDFDPRKMVFCVYDKTSKELSVGMQNSWQESQRYCLVASS